MPLTEQVVVHDPVASGGRGWFHIKPGGKRMKWMIASDIHGSAYYCRKLLEAYEKEEAERLLLLGDILYHGPRNDLPEGYAPKEVIELLNAHKNDIYCVRGNCDTEVDQMVLEFPVLADYCVMRKGRRQSMPHMDISITNRSFRRCIPGTYCCTDTLMCRSALYTKRNLTFI